MAIAGQPKPAERPQGKRPQFINQWIIPHGGDCCGCAISEDVGKEKYRIVCNECGEELHVMVSEVTFQRMAEALQRAQHALAFSNNHLVHDGKPEHSYVLDHRKELRFIEETLQLADVSPRPLDPLP